MPLTRYKSKDPDMYPRDIFVDPHSAIGAIALRDNSEGPLGHGLYIFALEESIAVFDPLQDIVESISVGSWLEEGIPNPSVWLVVTLLDGSRHLVRRKDIVLAFDTAESTLVQISYPHGNKFLGAQLGTVLPQVELFDQLKIAQGERDVDKVAQVNELLKAEIAKHYNFADEVNPS